MSRIIKIAKVLRRNWKKSTFFFGVIAYGTSYLNDRYKTFQMMKAYCKEAQIYGEKTLPDMTPPKHITVILNPEANYKKSVIQFEKFAAPLLHLAGIKVSIFQTEEKKQAIELMKIMSNTDAVVVAGGNGTLQEVVTGLLLRANADDENMPLGIIPLGKTNTLSQFLFGTKSSSNVQLMAEAVMAVIRESTINLDVLKIKYEEEENPIYAVCSFEQGAFANLEPRVQKYWYLGFLKDKYTYFINSFKNWPGLQISSMEYVEPCDGCTQCYVPPKRKPATDNGGRWWQAFIPRKRIAPSTEVIDLEKAQRINESCGRHISLPTSYSNISVLTSLGPNSNNLNCFWVKTFPENMSIKEFITSGLQHQKSKHSSKSPVLAAREISIVQPIVTDEELEDKKRTKYPSYIDNEEYPRGSYNISLLPRRITVYK